MNIELFQKAELVVCREILRREWSRAELGILRLIVERSFGLGRSRAKIPSLNYFCEFSGKAKPHVSDALASLREKLVVQEFGAGIYGINVLFRSWRAEEHPSGVSVHEQLDLLSPEPDLRDGLMESFLAECEIGSTFDLPANGGATVPDLRQPERSQPTQLAAMRLAGGNHPASGMRSTQNQAEAGTAHGPGELETLRALGLPGSPRGGDRNDGGAEAVTDLVTQRDPGVPGKWPSAKGYEFGNPELCHVHAPPGGETAQSVTESVTAARTAERFPPYNPLSKPVTGNGTTVPVQRDRKPGNGFAKSLVSREEERRLLGLIRKFVGDADYQAWQGMWRCRAVRNFPWAVDEALGEARMLIQTHREEYFAHRGRWLAAKIGQLAGVRLSEISAGPPPSC